MANQVTVAYYGVEGTGRTVTEAKKDAGAKIEKQLTGTYEPVIVSYRETAYVIYRTPDGYHAMPIMSGGKIREDHSRISCGNYDRHDVILAIRQHVSQLEWKPEDGETIPELLKPIGQLMPDSFRRAQADYLTWVKWWMRYRTAMEAGKNDNDAREYAGGRTNVL